MIPSTRRITCANKQGYAMTFDSTGFTPFILAHVDGIYGKKTNVTISQNTMIDGGTYQGSVATVRNIVLTFLDQPENFDNQDNRDTLYHLFNEGEEGTLTYEEGGDARYIRYYVESITRTVKNTNPITVSLLCPDPFFYDTQMNSYDMAEAIGDFEFEHDFVAGGEPLGHRSTVRSLTIENTAAATNIGLTFTITSSGAAVNPYIEKSETSERIQIGHAGFPFTLSSGQKLIITTGTGNKHVYLDVDGVVTEINGYLTEASRFIQLKEGANTFGFGADSGDDTMGVNISYRNKYEGA